MNKKILTSTVPIFAGLLLVLGVLSTNISAQEDSIPSWIKNTAGFWADNQISDMEFMNAIEYLIGQEIIQIPEAKAQVEKTSTTTATYYVVKEVIKPKFDNVAMFGDKQLFCEKGDTALAGGYEITVGDMWAYNNFPIKSSEELSYYDGWLFNFFGKVSKGSLGVSMYLTCADTNH